MEARGLVDVVALPARGRALLSIRGEGRGDAHRGRPFVGEHEVIRRVHKLIDRVADGPSLVLVRGESGTGKELVADAIHARSSRAGAPLIKVNCGALTDTLLHSELFGHERGAFTGAVERTRG